MVRRPWPAFGTQGHTRARINSRLETQHSKPQLKVWTSVELIRWTADYLAEKGFPDSRLNAELLLAGVLGVKRLDLYLQFERPLAAEELAEFKSRLKRRVRHEPLQYIAGTAQFRDLLLSVDPRVLIPRPETELLVGEVLAWSARRSAGDVLDLGTGSGAIALSLRQEGTFGRIVATDVSEDALQLARANLSANLPGMDVDFRQGSLFAPVQGERFDIIVSNPPYVGERERDGLAREVVDWEPAAALFSGSDGLDVIREIVANAPEFLHPGGLLALEIGATQAHEVAGMVRHGPSFGEPIVRCDLAGRDRIVLAALSDTGDPVGHPG